MSAREVSPKTLVMIFGPPAVGKMTVGYELAKLTGLRLFHNHMTIEVVLPFFDFGSPSFNHLVEQFRMQIFEEVAASDLPGLIFTFVWWLDDPGDRKLVDRMVEIFEEKNAAIHFVELAADLDERLRRNSTEFRLSQKASKRDLDRSTRNLLQFEQGYRMNTTGDFFYPDRHEKIDNTQLSPEEVARTIMERFSLAGPA